MKKFEKTITVYEIGEGFFVEVTVEGACKEYWLWNEGYGVKELMLGMEAIEYTDEEIIEANVADYIEDYKDTYMDDDEE